MCQTMEEWYQDALSEGLSQGLSQDLSQGVIETAQDFGLSKEDTIQKVMNKFNLQYTDALELVNTYWR